MRIQICLALAAFAMAAVATTEGAWSAASNCKGAACNDSGKGKGKGKGGGKDGAKGGNVEFEWKVEEGESSKRRKGLKGK